MRKLDVKNKILLLDFDGTLVDTEKLAVRVIEEYCVDKNLVSQESTLKNISQSIVGRTWKAAVHEIHQILPPGLLPESFESDLKNRYHSILHEGVEWIPGVREKLMDLRSKALAVVMVTGSSLHEVRTILEAEQNAHCFDLIWTAENYQESKPSPEPFLSAFEKIKQDLWQRTGRLVLPQDVLVFEDSKAGMESAHRAGFSFIQVLHSHPDHFPDDRALLSIRDWRELDWA